MCTIIALSGGLVAESAAKASRQDCMAASGADAPQASRLKTLCSSQLPLAPIAILILVSVWQRPRRSLGGVFVGTIDLHGFL